MARSAIRNFGPWLALGLGVLGGGVLLQVLSHPVLRDVTTNPSDPPCLAHPEVSSDLATPLDAARQEALVRAYPGLHGLLVSGKSLTEMGSLVEEMLRQEGLEVTELAGPGTAQERIHHAVATTRLLRFRDDVLVRCRSEEAGIRVDLRSASRVGKSDLGVNAARIRRLLEALGRRLRAPGR